MNTTIERVKVSSLLANPENLRADVGDIDGLAQSITENGLLQPMRAFRNEDGKLVLIAGHRRLAAIESLNGTGPKEVDVVVVDGDVDLTQATTEMLVENLQRSDLNPIEEAIGYARLSAVKIKQADIAKRVGVSASVVSRRLALLTLPEQVRTMVAAGDLDLELAEKLTALREDPEECVRLAGQSNLTGWHIDVAVKTYEANKKAAKLTELAEQAGVAILDDPYSVKELAGMAGCWTVVRQGATDEDLGTIETVDSALGFADVAGRPEPHAIQITHYAKVEARVFVWEPATTGDGATVMADDVDVAADLAKTRAKEKAAAERAKAREEKKAAEALVRNQQIVAAAHKGQDLADIHLEQMLRTQVTSVIDRERVLRLLGVEQPDDMRDESTGKVVPKAERWHATFERVVLNADRSKPAVRNRLHAAVLIATRVWTDEVHSYLAGFETT